MLLALGAGVVVGCGASDTGGDPPPSNCEHGCWQPNAADEAFVTDLCNTVESCCVANEYRTLPDVEACKKVFLKAGLSRDGSLRSKCLAEMKALATQGKNCVTEVWDLSDACVRLIYEPSGPQPPGRPCVNGADCAGAPGTVTLCSRVSSDVSPTFGICLRMTPGKPGVAGTERCLGTMSPDGLIFSAPASVAGQTAPITTGLLCEDRAGLYCGPVSNDFAPLWTCQPKLPDNATCYYATTCQSGECPPTDGGIDASYEHPGICTRRAATGQGCSDEDGTTLCVDGSYCNGAVGVCETKLGAGVACMGDSQCQSDNCDLDTHQCSPQTSGERLALLAYCSHL